MGQALGLDVVTRPGASAAKYLAGHFRRRGCSSGDTGERSRRIIWVGTTERTDSLVMFFLPHLESLPTHHTGGGAIWLTIFFFRPRGLFADCWLRIVEDIRGRR